MDLKRFISLLLMLILCLEMIPLTISSASTLNEVSEDDAYQKIYDLYNILGDGSYFTTTQTSSCGVKSSNHSCSYCHLKSILNTSWFINKFGSLSTNQFPITYYSGGIPHGPNGWSCFGFASFAEWYIYSSSQSDTVTTEYIGTFNYNYDGVAKNIRVGDIIRIGDIHSAIVISYDQTGVKVLESNGTGAYNCQVHIRTIKYSSRTYSISRALNSVKEYSCTHSYSGEITTEGNCVEPSIKTYTCTICGDSYTEEIPPYGEHSWSGWYTIQEPTCTQEGIKWQKCYGCYEEETSPIPALEHNYSNWNVITDSGCETTGEKQKICSRCGDVQSEIIPATAHCYIKTEIPATCIDYAKYQYYCVNCGDIYEEYSEDGYSEWTTVKPTNVPEEIIESKTQYRSSILERAFSKDPVVNGIAGTPFWYETGTQTTEYVKSWPDGFSRDSAKYTLYNNPIPVSSESETNKVVVNSDEIIGYLYFHWCRGTYTGGPMNRRVSSYYNGEFVSFHSFFSTTDPNSLTPSPEADGSYVHSNADCCKDSYWYFTVPVYRSEYTTYEKMYHHEQWSDWTNWGDQFVQEGYDLKVETRVVYRYSMTTLDSHTWVDGICSVCGHKNTGNIGTVGKWNVLLKGNLQVNYYLLINESLTDTQVKITVGNDEYLWDGQFLPETSEGYRIASITIAAAQMNDIISVQILNGGNSGEIHTYTVRQYCNTVLADDEHSEYHAIVKEMLNYGAMAQQYFDYNTENFANIGITGVATTDVPENAEELTVSDSVDALNFYGASLVYRDRIAVRYYFTGDVTGCRFTANGNSCETVSKDGMYYVEIADILPQDLDQQVTLTTEDSHGNLLTVSYSPMNYIVRMNEKGSDTLKALVKALYNYHLAAKALQTQV